MSSLSIHNSCMLPTPIGEFHMCDTGDDAVRLVALGDLADLGPEPLLRVHSSCLASEVFGSMDCDCADQLRSSMRMIAEEGRGLVVHLQQEGRGHGLSRKIAAVGLMQRGALDTFAAMEALGLEQDVRRYESVVGVLRDLRLKKVRLISNNPRKESELRRNDIEVAVVRVPPAVRPENREYLQVKASRLGHEMVLDAADDGVGPVRFYHSDQRYGELSNFSRHAVFLNSCVWPTAEHCYQAHRFTEAERREAVRTCPTPIAAKNLAGCWRSHCRTDWAAMKETVMLEVLRAKFTQHPDLQRLLVETGTRRLVEHTPTDAYWGDRGDGTGANRLGVLLMRVRAELSASSRPLNGAS